MSIEALLTIVGLGVAVYAVLPTDRRLDLKLRMSRADWTAALIALLLVHYIAFYPVFLAIGVAPNLGPWRWGFTPETASYAILFVTLCVLFLAFRTRRGRIPPRKIPIFAALATRMLHERQYSDVIFLLENYARSLSKAYKRDYWLPKLRERLDPPVSVQFLQAVSGRKQTPLPQWLMWSESRPVRRLRASIARVLPDGEKYQEAADEIIRRLVASDDFVAELMRSRPYLAIELLRLGLGKRSDLLKAAVRALLADKRSVLYYEVRHNDNLRRGHRYYLNPSHRFLTFFFEDADKAKETSVYAPFGEFALKTLNEYQTGPDASRYNGPLEDFYEEGRWVCPIFVVIRLFDIMVLEALHQGVEWHMWLYYFTYITERIIRNIDMSDQRVVLSNEWPTPYHYLLYETVSALRDWIDEVKEVPKEQSNIQIERTDTFHENGSIAKSAVLALGSVMRDVIKTDKLADNFKRYLLDIVLRLLRDLKQNNQSRLTTALENSLVAGGPRMGDDSEYRFRLTAVLRDIDIVLLIDHSLDVLNNALHFRRTAP